METSRMSAQQTASLLAADDVAPDLVDRLKSDSRAFVVKLLDKWQRRKTANSEEQLRLAALFRYEEEFYTRGYRLIAGVDEAGRGPLAGPVVIAAVILSAKTTLEGLNDSKKLSAKQRDELYEKISRAAIAITYEVVDVDLIDRINIYQATLYGMYAVLRKLQPLPEVALIDAMPLRDLKIPHMSIVDGDALSASIAAASIIAKVERDRIMGKLDEVYPQYGFGKHKGYATPEHISALEKCGPCRVHRKSFSPVKNMGTLLAEES